MGFDLCVLWQVVSLINLKMKSMLAFDKRYCISGAIPRRPSLPVYMPWFALSLTFVFISLPS